MKPKIRILTIGVDDLERSVKFYRDGLGLPTEGIIGTQFEHGAIAFFELEAGMKLAVFRRDDLALDAKIEPTPPGSTEFSIGHLVDRKSEVDEVMELARKAGARIVKPGQDAFWGGYHGYFQDPDGHLWEILWNPDSVTG
jgi:catechol 2,3-dioxygenase-like lactoylglutathione lyase family enzyme